MSVITDIEGKSWMALRSGFEVWSETRIHWPNEKFTPAANEAYIIIDPVWLDVDISSTDPECGEELRGFLNVRVMTPTTWDYAQALGLIGRMSALFPPGLMLQYYDCDVKIYRKPKSFGGTTLENAWHRNDIRIYWRTWG